MGTGKSMARSKGQDPGTMRNYCSRSHEKKYRKNLGYHSHEDGKSSSVSTTPHFCIVPFRVLHRGNKTRRCKQKGIRETKSTRRFFSLLLRDEEDWKPEQGETCKILFLVRSF